MKKEPAPESGALLSIGQVVTVVIGYPDSGSGDDLSRYSRRIVGAIGQISKDDRGTVSEHHQLLLRQSGDRG